MMERRKFLVASAMALPMMGANEKVNVAVVGVGGRGSAHVREYLTIPSARIAALCDVNTAATERNEQVVLKGQGDKPKIYQDLRKLYEDKEIDAVSIATPNHWHALATIWACQAGKDVYVEKPTSHSIWESRKMVDAARKYRRVVQVGTQNRSAPYIKTAIEYLRSGKLGKVHFLRIVNSKLRPGIGRKPDSNPPDGVDYDMWLGPAPSRHSSDRHCPLVCERNLSQVGLLDRRHPLLRRRPADP
jgi:predicted dehydrogenase